MDKLLLVMAAFFMLLHSSHEGRRPSFDFAEEIDGIADLFVPNCNGITIIEVDGASLGRNITGKAEKGCEEFQGHCEDDPCQCCNTGLDCFYKNNKEKACKCVDTGNGNCKGLCTDKLKNTKPCCAKGSCHCCKEDQTCSSDKGCQCDAAKCATKCKSPLTPCCEGPQCNCCKDGESCKNGECKKETPKCVDTCKSKCPDEKPTPCCVGEICNCCENPEEKCTKNGCKPAECADPTCEEACKDKRLGGGCCKTGTRDVPSYCECCGIGQECKPKARNGTFWDLLSHDHDDHRGGEDKRCECDPTACDQHCEAEHESKNGCCVKVGDAQHCACCPKGEKCEANSCTCDADLCKATNGICAGCTVEGECVVDACDKDDCEVCGAAGCETTCASTEVCDGNGNCVCDSVTCDASCSEGPGCCDEGVCTCCNPDQICATRALTNTSLWMNDRGSSTGCVCDEPACALKCGTCANNVCTVNPCPTGETCDNGECKCNVICGPCEDCVQGVCTTICDPTEECDGSGNCVCDAENCHTSCEVGGVPGCCEEGVCTCCDPDQICVSRALSNTSLWMNDRASSTGCVCDEEACALKCGTCANNICTVNPCPTGETCDNGECKCNPEKCDTSCSEGPGCCDEGACTCCNPDQICATRALTNTSLWMNDRGAATACVCDEPACALKCGTCANNICTVNPCPTGETCDNGECKCNPEKCDTSCSEGPGCCDEGACTCCNPDQICATRALTNTSLWMNDRGSSTGCVCDEAACELKCGTCVNNICTVVPCPTGQICDTSVGECKCDLTTCTGECSGGTTGCCDGVTSKCHCCDPESTCATGSADRLLDGEGHFSMINRTIGCICNEQACVTNKCGTCVHNKCEPTTCPTGETCDNGECKCNGICGPCETCVGGVCTTTCDPTEKCDGSGNCVCDAENCHASCEAGGVTGCCEEGVCACCDPDQICVSRALSNTSLWMNDRASSTGCVCDQQACELKCGTCVNNVCTVNPCPTGETCDNGECKCNGICGPCETCVGGVCTTTCGPSEACDKSGNCVCKPENCDTSCSEGPGCCDEGVCTCCNPDQICATRSLTNTSLWMNDRGSSTGCVCDEEACELKCGSCVDNICKVKACPIGESCIDGHCKCVPDKCTADCGSEQGCCAENDKKCKCCSSPFTCPLSRIDSKCQCDPVECKKVCNGQCKHNQCKPNCPKGEQCKEGSCTPTPGWNGHSRIAKWIV